MNHYFTHFDSLFKGLHDNAWDCNDYAIPAERKAEVCSMPNFPHSNVWMSEDTNSLTMEFALAGYSKDEISVTANNGVVSVAIDPCDTDESVISVHRGISRRKVNFSLNIDKAFNAKEAKTLFEDGILRLTMTKDKECESIKLM